MFESSIEGFYNDYTPVRYRRTYSTYLASDMYNDMNNYTFNPVEGGDGAEIGLHASSSNLGNPYRAHDTEWVFKRTFEKGIHGFTRYEASEWDKQKKWSKVLKKKKDGSWIKVSMRPTKGHSPVRYRYKDSEKTGGRRTKSPKADMDRRMKEFRSSEELKNIVDSCFAAALKRNL